jgi:hypothetical protein
MILIDQSISQPSGALIHALPLFSHIAPRSVGQYNAWKVSPASPAAFIVEQKYLRTTTLYAVHKRAVLMGAVGIHPMAVDNSWQFRPHESPANDHIMGDAGGAVGIFPDFVTVATPNLHLSSAPDDQGILKASLNVPVADEKPFDDPEGLTGSHES